MAVPKYYEYSGLTYSGLQGGETLIGKGMLAYWVPVLSLGGMTSCDSHPGTLYVTDRRVFFRTMWSGGVEFQLKLPEIRGFSVEKRGFFTQVTLHSRAGERLWFTGFSVKKMQGWLRQAGVRALEEKPAKPRNGGW